MNDREWPWASQWYLIAIVFRQVGQIVPARSSQLVKICSKSTVHVTNPLRGFRVHLSTRFYKKTQ